jgi:Flp pilus assembly protein TadG
MRNNLIGIRSLSIGRRILAFLRSDSDGGAILEAAIALPVYLIMITGTLAVVMALQAYQQLAFACYTASVAVGAGRGTQADPCALVYNNVVDALPTWKSNEFAFNLWITYNSGTSTSIYTPGAFNYSNASCTGTYTVAGNGNYALYNAQHNPVMVQVTYTYTWLPVFGIGMYGNGSMGNGNLLVREASIVQ